MSKQPQCWTTSRHWQNIKNKLAPWKNTGTLRGGHRAWRKNQRGSVAGPLIP